MIVEHRNKNEVAHYLDHTVNEDARSHYSQSSADEGSVVSAISGVTKCCTQGSLGLRRWQMFQMMILLFIPITVLIIQNSTLLFTVVANVKEAWEIKEQLQNKAQVIFKVFFLSTASGFQRTNTIIHIGKLLAELQEERAEFGFCLFTNDPEMFMNTSSSRCIGVTLPTPKTTKSRKIKHAASDFLPSTTTFSISSVPSDQTETPITTMTISTEQSTDHEKGMSDKMRQSLCRDSLTNKFNRTESVVQNLSTYVSGYVPSIASLRAKRERVFQLTGEMDESVDDTTLNELLWYNVANDVILDLLSNQIGKTTTSAVWKVLIAYKNIINSIENYSISMIYGLYYFGKGKLSQDSFNKYVHFDSLASDYLNATKSFSPEITILWDKFISKNGTEGFMKIMLRKAVIYRNDRKETSASESSAKSYYANMTNFIKELRKFQGHLRDMLDNQVTDEITDAKSNIVASTFLLLLVILISPIIIYLVRNVTETIQQYAVMLNSKTMDIRREKRKSDRLLQQMLPGEVIRQLRANKHFNAESFDSVTIYFSDIVGFTSISSSSSPIDIIVMLNSLYKTFDSCIENYDVYKVETIGDSYMVVSGLPTRNGNLHVGEICTMALAILEAVKNFRVPRKPELRLQIRVGINTGCCVAGVIGTKMPRYCLFGDAINVASRMECHAEPMKIHITESTKSLLDEIGGYVTENRGLLDVKGKGEMNTFWLLSKIGGIPRTLEIQTPGYFFAADEHTPEYLWEIFD